MKLHYSPEKRITIYTIELFVAEREREKGEYNFGRREKVKRVCERMKKGSSSTVVGRSEGVKA